MTNPTMTSQWDPGNYEPLDMRKIPGYPRKMPLSYKKWVPIFFGRDGESPDYHMSQFWEFFQHFPVRDEAEDIVMKLFSSSLHEEAKKWYDSLPAASITSMDHFEEIFLERWALKLEDVQLLLKELEGVRQEDGELVHYLWTKFQKLLHQIPERHRPGGKFLVYLFTNGLQAHLSFLLNKRKPGTLKEARDMAIQIERNLISRGISSFTMNAITLMEIVSLEGFDAQEVEKRVSKQNENVNKEQESEQDNKASTCAPPTDEVMQELVSPIQQREEEVSHFPSQDAKDTVYSEDEEEMEASNKVEVSCCKIEDKEAVHEDEAPEITPQPDEALQGPINPAQDEENEVSHFDSFDDALFYDSENEERTETLDELDPPCLKTEDVERDLSSDNDIQILEALAQEGLSEVHCSPFQVLNSYLPYDIKSEKVLDVLTPPCYDTDTDIADFDEFIHVGRRRWDIVGYGTDPIYDVKDHFQTLPLQLPQQISFDQWQQGDEVFTCSLQNTKDDSVPYLSDEFQSYLEMFDEYPTEHLDPIYEDDCQPLLCSNLNTSKDIVCLKEGARDFSSQPPVSTLPCFSIQGVVGKYLFRVEFPPGQTLDFKGWLGNTFSNQCFNLLLTICQPSTKPVSVLSLILESEDVLGDQFTGPLSRFSEPCAFHDLFLDRIECFSQKWNWRDFVPPTRLHELEFGTLDDVIYVLTHDVFVLDLSLFWFMMKHKGRYQGALLDWLHWLFDYTNMQPAGKYR
jgi:hypothetical protein